MLMDREPDLEARDYGIGSDCMRLSFLLSVRQECQECQSLCS